MTDAAFDGHGFQVHVGPNKPESRGSVEVVSANPNDKPKIESITSRRNKTSRIGETVFINTRNPINPQPNALHKEIQPVNYPAGWSNQ